MLKKIAQIGASRLLLAICWAGTLWAGWATLRPLLARLAAPALHRDYYPPDFMQFYFAGELANAGHIAQLYHKPAYVPLVQQMLAQGEYVACCYPKLIRPPYIAFFCIPFAWFSYGTGLLVVTLANLALLGALAWKLPIWFRLSGWSRVGIFGFVPFLWSIGIVQETLLLTLLMAYALHLASQNREIAAGAILGFCASKPHLVWLLPLALFASGKRRMNRSLLATTGVLALISLLAVGWTGVREWIAVVRQPYSDYAPELMGNLRALWRVFGPASALIAAFVTFACLIVILWKGSFRERFSAAILTALLVSPHTYLQDYSLLVVVAVLDTRPIARLFLLLPWMYFYHPPHLLLWIFVGLIWLVATAAEPLFRPWWNGIIGRRPESLAATAS